MKNRVIAPLFIVIGVLIGIIFSLQFRAQPVGSGSFAFERIEIQRALLTEYSLEQNELKTKLVQVEDKLKEAQDLIEQRTSRQRLKELDALRLMSGFNTVTGDGIRVVLRDNQTVSRRLFSSVNQNFVQASDVRDLVNELFLKDAKAITVNGNRVLPLTSIQPVADNLLVGNFFEVAPFVVEAVGDPDALIQAVAPIQSRKISVFVDTISNITVGPVESGRSIKFLKLAQGL